MNGTRKRTTTKLDGGRVEHLASFHGTTALNLTDAREMLTLLENELGAEGIDATNAEVRVLGKGFRMTGATLTGLALVVTEKKGRADGNR